MKISGLDAFKRKMTELEKAVADLDGHIAEVIFDPHDPASFDPHSPASIELAIQKYHIAVDEKVAMYAHNELVVAIRDEYKENGRKAILELAATARQGGEKEV
jgi:hypothetical protein